MGAERLWSAETRVGECHQPSTHTKFCSLYLKAAFEITTRCTLHSLKSLRSDQVRPHIHPRFHNDKLLPSPRMPSNSRAPTQSSHTPDLEPKFLSDMTGPSLTPAGYQSGTTPIPLSSYYRLEADLNHISTKPLLRQNLPPKPHLKHIAHPHHLLLLLSTPLRLTSVRGLWANCEITPAPRTYH
jgi:hypothetical protein